MPAKRSSGPSKVVGAERVLAVLTELGKHPGGVSLDEITAIMGQSKPTIHRALATLQKSGLGAKTDRGSYLLGDEFVRIANQFQSARPELLNLEPAMRKLANKFGETVHFAVLDGNDVVYRAKVEAPQGAVQISSVVGGRNPAHNTAEGKILLAYELDSYEGFVRWLRGVRLKRHTENTVISARKLWDFIEASGKQGFAIDDQEYELGINCIAFPVFTDGSDKPIGAISVTGLSFRSPLNKLVRARREIKNIVEAI